MALSAFFPREGNTRQSEVPASGKVARVRREAARVRREDSRVGKEAARARREDARVKR
jgi:hypothetical protein